MTIEIIKYFISDHTVTFIFALATLAIVAWVFVMIIRHHRTEKLHDLDTIINSIPLLVGLIPLSYFLTHIYSLYRAIISIRTSGTGDPRVVAAGLAEMFIECSLSIGLFFIFLMAWLVMRMMHERFLNELEKKPELTP